MTTETEQGTFEALLAAARSLFAERGYDGASVRAITTRAGANLGAITYHFGSKRALYDRVVESCIAPLMERVEGVARGAGAPLDRVEGAVRAFFDYMRATPELPRLMMQELAVGRPPPEAAVGPIRRMQATLVALVEEGQAAGSMRGGDPMFMVVSVVAQPIHFGLVGRAFCAIMGRDPDDPAHWDGMVRNAVTFVRGGLAAHGEGGR